MSLLGKVEKKSYFQKCKSKVRCIVMLCPVVLVAACDSPTSPFPSVSVQPSTRDVALESLVRINSLDPTIPSRFVQAYVSVFPPDVPGISFSRYESAEDLGLLFADDDDAKPYNIDEVYHIRGDTIYLLWGGDPDTCGKPYFVEDYQTEAGGYVRSPLRIVFVKPTANSTECTIIAQGQLDTRDVQVQDRLSGK